MIPQEKIDAKTKHMDDSNKERFNEGVRFAEAELKSVAMEFAEWIEKLNPAQRTSVWSKNGEYNGLFTMDYEQLFVKFEAERKAQ